VGEHLGLWVIPLSGYPVGPLPGAGGAIIAAEGGGWTAER
jgi:hypothetical protein